MAYPEPIPDLKGKDAERMIKMLENPKPLTKAQQAFYRQAYKSFGNHAGEKFNKGYAVVYCGGHILAQIDLKEWPVEIVSRRKYKCPECGSEVNIHGCAAHHKEVEHGKRKSKR